MRTAARFALLALGPAIYWAVAAFVILVSGWALPGDRGTEETVQGANECLVEVRAVVLIVLAVAVLIYARGIRRILRRP